jgi:hypothetical protein
MSYQKMLQNPIRIAEGHGQGSETEDNHSFLSFDYLPPGSNRTGEETGNDIKIERRICNGHVLMQTSMRVL